MGNLTDKRQNEIRSAVKKQYETMKSGFKAKYGFEYKENRNDVALENRAAYDKAIAEYKTTTAMPDGSYQALTIKQLQTLSEQYNFNELFGSVDDATATKNARAKFLATLPKNIREAMEALKAQTYVGSSSTQKLFNKDAGEMLLAKNAISKVLQDKFGMKNEQDIETFLQKDPVAKKHVEDKGLLQKYRDAQKVVRDNKLKYLGYANLLKQSGYTKANLAWFFNDDKYDWTTRDMSGVAMSSRGTFIDPSKVKGYNIGGRVIGSDTVPAMLTPGEFVVRKYAVQNFGADKLKAINNGTYKGDSMYNYEVNVNVQTDADADQIAKAVIGQIKQIDSQRIRGNRF